MPGKEFWENGRDKHKNGGLVFKMPPKRIHDNFEVEFMNHHIFN